MRIVIQPSTHCNLRCSYCYQHQKNSNVLTFEQIKILLDDLFSWKRQDYANSKIFRVFIGEEAINILPVTLDFFGGESTLHIDLIKQTCQYFEDLCDKYNETEMKETYKITVQTNGTTFFEPEVNEFYHKYASRIQIPISIDGCKECHNACRKYANGKGSYDDVEKAILAHNELLGHEPNTKLTFSLENMKYIPAVVRTLARLGYHTVRSSCDIAHSLTRAESEQYYDYLVGAIDYIINNRVKFFFSFFWSDDFMIVDGQPRVRYSTCGSDGSQIVLNYNGNLYFCAQLSEATVDKEKEICLGNVYDGITEDGLAKLTEFRKFIRIKDSCCLDCPLRFFCDDCPAMNLLKSGSAERCSPNCGAVVAEIRASIYFATRAKETDYPYFKEQVENILKYIKYDPDRKYLMDEKGE